MKAYIVIVRKAYRKQYDKFVKFLIENFDNDNRLFTLGSMSWVIMSDKSAADLHQIMTAYIPEGSQLFIFGWGGTELAQWTDDPEADTALNEIYKQATKKYIPLINEFPRVD